jgi:hypothetical protein
VRIDLTSLLTPVWPGSMIFRGLILGCAISQARTTPARLTSATKVAVLLRLIPFCTDADSLALSSFGVQAKRSWSGSRSTGCDWTTFRRCNPVVESCFGISSHQTDPLVVVWLQARRQQFRATDPTIDQSTVSLSTQLCLLRLTAKTELVFVALSEIRGRSEAGEGDDGRPLQRG